MPKNAYFSYLLLFLLVVLGLETSWAQKIENGDLDRFYPMVLGSQWVYQEQKDGKSKSVTIALEKPVTINNEEAFLFKGKNCGLAYVVQRKADGLYLLKNNRPLLGLLDMDIDFTPPLKILNLPPKSGEQWSYQGRAGNWISSKPVEVQYTNLGTEKRKYRDGFIEAYKIQAEFTIDHKRPVTQITWYGEGVGYMGSQAPDLESNLVDYSTPPLVHHILLEVKDLKTSIHFYRDVMGLRLTSQSGDFATLEAQNVGIYLWNRRWDWEKPRQPGERQGLGMYPHFETDDVEALVKKLDQAGYTIIQRPRHYDWGTEAFVADPDGYIWSLVNMKKTD